MDITDIQATCEELGVSLAELAREMGITPTYLSQILHGTKKRNTRVVAKLQAVRRRHGLIGPSLTPDEAEVLYGYRTANKLDKTTIISVVRLTRDKKNNEITQKKPR